MRQPALRLDRKVLFLWWTVGAVLTILAVAGAAFVVTFLDLSAFLYLPALLVAIVAFGIPLLRYRRWRYEIRPRDLYFSHGAIFFRQTLIPFDRIQFVESRQGPLDRVFGLWQVIVYTAAGKAGQIPGLNLLEADQLREELSRVAGTTSV